MPRRRSLWLLPAAVLAATAFSGAPALAEDPEELVIGFVPSVEAGALVEDIQPLADFLEEALGIPVEGFVSTDYTALVTALQTDQAHIAAMPPFGLVQAVDNAGAEMILQSERFGSPSYHTQFLTNNPDKYCLDDPVENERQEGDEMVTVLNCNGTDRAFDEAPIGPIGIEGLELVEAGTEVSFTEPTSASGFIFPATVFATLGLSVDDLEAVFAGGHDASVIAVCEGQAEVGVSFDEARTDAAEISDCDITNTVVVFAYGPEIPNDGLAVAGDLSDELKASIKQAFLDFAATDEGKVVLDEIYNITAFAEPVESSLQIIRDAVAELGYGS